MRDQWEYSLIAEWTCALECKRSMGVLTDSGVDMRSRVSRIRFAVDDVTEEASDLFTGFAVTVFR